MVANNFSRDQMKLDKAREKLRKKEAALRKKSSKGEIIHDRTSLQAELFYVNNRPSHINTNRLIDIDDIVSLERAIAKQYGFRVTILGLSNDNNFEHICIESDAVYLSSHNYPYLSSNSIFPLGTWDGQDVFELSEMLSDCYSEFELLFRNNIIGAMQSSFIKRSDFYGRQKKKTVLSNSFLVDKKGKAMLVTQDCVRCCGVDVSNGCIISPDTKNILKLTEFTTLMLLKLSYNRAEFESAASVSHFIPLNPNSGTLSKFIELKKGYAHGR